MSEYIFPQSDTLAESYPKLQNELIRQNEEDKRLQDEIDKHKDSNDHTADKIRYEGKIAKNNVKDAIDETDTRIDNIVSQGGSDNTEVVDARHSTTKGKTYDTLKGRLEDGEQEVVDARHSTTKGKTYDTLKGRLEDGEQDIEKLKTDTSVAESVSETSYDSVISVPDSATNGQVSGAVKGRTYSNLLGADGSGITLNNTSAVRGSRIQENNYIKFNVTDTTGADSRLQIMKSFEPNRTYFVTFDYILNTTAEQGLRVGIMDNLARVISNMNTVTNSENWTRAGCKITPTDEGNTIVFQLATSRSLSDFFKIRNIIVVDITDESNLTEGELLQKYPYVSGTRSTLGSMRIKSVGKNLFSEKWELGTINLNTGESARSDTFIRSNYIPVSSNTNYIVTDPEQISHNARNVQYALFYDECKNFIKSVVLTMTPITFTTPSNCKYVRFRSQAEGVNNYVIGDYLNYKTQLEHGDTITEYEPYIEDRAYITAKKDDKILELSSLPNGVKDEVDLTNNTVTKRISKYFRIRASDIDAVGDLDTVYRYHIKNVASKFPNFLTHTSAGRSIAFNNIQLKYKHDWVGNYEHYYIDHNATGAALVFFIDKTKVSDNSAESLVRYFNTHLITLIYQLAEPEIIPVRWTGLNAYENGTVYVDTVIPELGFYYDNGLESLYPDHPIKEIDTLYRVDKETGYEEPLDTSLCVIAEDRLSFTHPDLVDGDLCDWDYVPMTESTRPETSLTFPSNLKASVNSLLDAEKTNKKEHNIFKARLDNHDGDIERIDDDIESIDADIENVQSDIDTHKQDSNNPHNVTPEQIGAETPSGAQAKIDVVANDFESHKAETITDDVHGLYTRLGDLRIINFTLYSNSSVKLKFSEGTFICLLLMQGTQATVYGAFVLQGYGIGGTRYKVGEIQKGSDITVSVDADGESSFTVSNTSNVGASCRIVMFLGSPPEII